MTASEFDTLMQKWAKIQENSGGYSAASSLVGGMSGVPANRYRKDRTQIGFAEDEVGYLNKLMKQLQAIPAHTNHITSLQCYYLYDTKQSLEMLDVPKQTFYFWKNKGIKLVINAINTDLLSKNASMPVL